MAKLTGAKITRTDTAETTPVAVTPAAQTTKPAPAQPATRSAAKPTTKPAAKTTAKTSAKTSASVAKKPSKPTARKTAPKTKPDAAVIQADLRKLEARLKRADTITRKSVTALQTVVSTLDARLNSTTSSQKGQLSRHVNALSAQLDDQTKKTREIVRHELKTALSAGGLARMEAAVARASSRIDAAELAQADAVTRLNRHLADMARAVDARIAQEAADRARDIEGVNARLEAAITEARSDIGARVDTVDARVETVERDSAEALTRFGETIEKIHDKLETRRQSSADVVTEKVNELALQTQAEFEAYQAKLEARINELETRHGEIDPAALSGVAEDAAARLRLQLSAQIEQLQSRIEGLEHASAVTATVPAQPPAPLSPAMSSPAPQTGPMSATPPAPIAFDPGNPYASALQSQTQGAGASSQMGTALGGLGGPARPDHFPVEFDPVAFAAQETRESAQIVAFVPPRTVQTPVATPPARPAEHSPVQPVPQMAPPPAPAPTARPTPPPAPISPPPFDPAMIQPLTPRDANPLNALVSRQAQASDAPAQQTPTQPRPTSLTPPPQPDFAPIDPLDFEPAPLPEAPYANPAYAETEGGSPKAVRITDGGDADKRARRAARRAEKAAAKAASKAHTGEAPGLRGVLSGRNAKLGLLMGGVVIVAVFAGKSILSTGLGPSSGPVTMTDKLQAALEPQLDDPVIPAPILVDPSVETTAPIGQYEEARALKINRAQLGTLQAAVKRGDAVAQFQLGLAELEQGNDARAAELIKLSADQELAVALYQLGKLHETGRGVDEDPNRARLLIERAARSGNRIAMHDLALYHTEGRGGAELNMLTARSWFEQAASRGVVDSQFNLAVLSESTESGLQPDLEEAYFWYSVAAAQGDKFAIGRLEAMSGNIPADARERLDARVAEFQPRPIDETANGIFRDVAWLQPTKPAADPSTLSAQTLLAQLGYAVGTPDGLMGAKTQAAITEFERSNGLPETGAVSQELLERLEIATGA